MNPAFVAADMARAKSVFLNGALRLLRGSSAGAGFAGSAAMGLIRARGLAAHADGANGDTVELICDMTTSRFKSGLLH